MAARKNPALAALLIVILIGILAMVVWWFGGFREQQVASPEEAATISVEQPKERYDLIVVGTDPEGITAAVSAARNGLKTLLVDSKDREILGGLFTLGWLNSLDMNRAPGSQSDYLNKGLFKEWFDQVEGDSFDTTTAAVVFNRMVRAEKNIDLLMKNKAIEPLVEEYSGRRKVIGVKLTLQDGSVSEVESGAVIDATQDADIAAAAGASFTIGREDLGDPAARMVVTPVFKIANVTNEVWKDIKKRLNGDDNPGTGANEVSAWGYGEMWNYVSTQPDVLRTRGLNIGRQNDNTALVNAVQVFGMDGLDPASLEQTKAALEKELPLIFDYMKELYPEFMPVELDGLAPELYVRETRHLIGEYRLTMVDLLEQRDHWDRIAFGSYEVDIQSTSPDNRGAVVMEPEQYAVPFRTLVPKAVDGMLVVGRSASFDSLPHGSARVVPLGMATGEAAGAAAKVAADAAVTFRELSASRELVKKLQDKLTAQGVDLVPKKLDTPDYMKHYAYEGLKAAASMAIAIGSYSNDFKLDEPSNPKRMVNAMNAVAKVHRQSGAFPGKPDGAIEEMPLEDLEKEELALKQAANTILLAAGEAVYAVSDSKSTAASDPIERLKAKGWLTDATIKAIPNPAKLTNGDVYLLLRDVVEGAVGVVYE